MKKALRGMVALAGLTVFGMAQAASWVDTGSKDAHGATYGIDTTSIKVESEGVVRAWFRAQYNPPQRGADGKSFSSSKFIDRFDCKAGTVSYGPMYLYNINGEIVASSTTYDAPHEPVPESIADNLMKLTCVAAGMQK